MTCGTTQYAERPVDVSIRLAASRVWSRDSHSWQVSAFFPSLDGRTTPVAAGGRRQTADPSGGRPAVRADRLGPDGPQAAVGSLETSAA